jgi:hypothetical protein
MVCFCHLMLMSYMIWKFGFFCEESWKLTRMWWMTWLKLSVYLGDECLWWEEKVISTPIVGWYGVIGTRCFDWISRSFLWGMLETHSNVMDDMIEIECLFRKWMSLMRRKSYINSYCWMLWCGWYALFAWIVCKTWWALWLCAWNGEMELFI